MHMNTHTQFPKEHSFMYAKLWQFVLSYNMKGGDASPVWVMAEYPVPATVSLIILPSFYQSNILHHLKCHSFKIPPPFIIL